MNSAKKLLDLAEIGHAGYGQFSKGLIDDIKLLTNLNGIPKGFAEAQAKRFSERFQVALNT